MTRSADDLRLQGASSPAPRKLKVCLAASGGGHLHEMLDLRPYWESHDCHFVTEPTPIARSLATSERVHCVPEIALGHFRHRSYFSVLRTTFQNFRAAWRAVRRERPDLVISTGAGGVFFAVLFAKLHGAKYIHIEAFCRFETPTIFGRLVHRFADAAFVQSARLAGVWPNVEVFDPFVRLPPSTSVKDDLAVVTVGTVLPFDRLVKSVASLSAEQGRPSRIIAQVGVGGVHPEGMETEEHIDFEELTGLLEKANVVFCHGGNGSLMTALEAGCRVIAMPRRGDLGEHWDDHQGEILRAFAARGLIEVAEDTDDLPGALRRALAKPPQRARNDHSALIARLHSITHEWFGKGKYDLPAAGSA